MKAQWIFVGVVVCGLTASTAYLLLQPVDPAPAIGTEEPHASREPVPLPANTAPVARAIGKDGLPPIDLKLKNASLAEVADALADQMNGAVAYNRGPLNSTSPADGTYTVDLTNRTLWEIIAILDDQRLINVHRTPAGISLDENARSAGGHAVSGPFFLQVFERPIPQSKPPSLGLQYAFLADPRLKVVSISFSMTLTTTRNGATVGRSLGYMPFNGSTKSDQSAGAGASSLLQHAWEADVTDVYTSITASATYTLQSGEQRLAEFQCSVGQPPH